MFILNKSFWEVKTLPNSKMEKNRGVFAKKEIPGGIVIGDYLGKITAEEDEDEKKYGTYYMWYSDDSSIYADPSKEGVQLINHSCMPNCGMIEYDTHILYYSLRKIFKGEELSVSYDLGFPGDDCNPCTHQCYCKTPLCKGTTHSVEFDDDEVKKNEKIEYLKPGEELKPFAKYPKTIKDEKKDNIYASLNRAAITLNDPQLPPLRLLKKQIRETGRILHFPKLNLSIYGLDEGFLLTKLK